MSLTLPRVLVLCRDPLEVVFSKYKEGRGAQNYERLKALLAWEEATERDMQSRSRHAREHVV